MSKKHYWLASAAIFLPDAGVGHTNIMVLHEHKHITADILQYIQKASEAQLKATMGELPEHYSFVINNISYLGEMTNEEFQHVPE